MVESQSNKITVWLSQAEFFAGHSLTGHICVHGQYCAEELKLSFVGYDNLTEWQRHQNGPHRYLRCNF